MPCLPLFPNKTCEEKKTLYNELQDARLRLATGGETAIRIDDVQSGGATYTAGNMTALKDLIRELGEDICANCDGFDNVVAPRNRRAVVFGYRGR